MPIYEYRCLGCGASFERLLRGGAQPRPCATCGRTDLEKLLSLPRVASDQTRKRASRDIRARNRATRQEQDAAEVRRIEAHSRDHDD